MFVSWSNYVWRSVLLAVMLFAFITGIQVLLVDFSRVTCPPSPIQMTCLDSRHRVYWTELHGSSPHVLHLGVCGSRAGPPGISVHYTEASLQLLETREFDWPMPSDTLITTSMLDTLDVDTHILVASQSRIICPYIIKIDVYSVLLGGNATGTLLNSRVYFAYKQTVLWASICMLLSLGLQLCCGYCIARSRRRRGKCCNCGYTLLATPRCPECGRY